jgi:predicted transcriptional regulator
MMASYYIYEGIPVSNAGLSGKKLEKWERDQDHLKAKHNVSKAAFDAKKAELKDEEERAKRRKKQKPIHDLVDAILQAIADGDLKTTSTDLKALADEHVSIQS